MTTTSGRRARTVVCSSCNRGLLRVVPHPSGTVAVCRGCGRVSLVVPAPRQPRSRVRP